MDRNALQDLLKVIRFCRDEVEMTPDIRTIADYWSDKWSEDAPWGACAIVYNSYTNLVLAIQGDKGLGVPGGKPEPGETPYQTANRELYEETGHKLDPRTACMHPPIATEKGVQVHFAFTDLLLGAPRSSAEGFVCWVPPSVLVSKFARFPRWNAQALTVCGIAF